MGKVGKFILKQLISNDFCFIIGDSDIIDEFSRRFEIDVKILMADFECGETGPIEAYNPETEETHIIGLVNKTELQSIALQKIKHEKVSKMKQKEHRNEVKNLIGIIVDRKRGVQVISAKDSKERKNIIDKLFNFPKNKEKHEKHTKRTKATEDDEYRGYA